MSVAEVADYLYRNSKAQNYSDINICLKIF